MRDIHIHTCLSSDFLWDPLVLYNAVELKSLYLTGNHSFTLTGIFMFIMSCAVLTCTYWGVVVRISPGPALSPSIYQLPVWPAGAISFGMSSIYVSPVPSASTELKVLSVCLCHFVVGVYFDTYVCLYVPCFWCMYKVPEGTRRARKSVVEKNKMDFYEISQRVLRTQYFSNTNNNCMVPI